MSWQTPITLIASAEIKAGAISAYSNAIQGSRIALELDVTIAPRGGNPTLVRVFAQRSIDGKAWGVEQMLCQFPAVSAVSQYISTAPIDCPYIRLAISPVDYKLTASVRASVD